MQIHIIRHGQTEFNVGESRFRGQLDIPLSEVGDKQAEAVALALKAIPLNTIYYSPLKRAKVTAERIRLFHPKASFVEEPYLITLNFGDWQGKYHHEVFTTEEKQQWKLNPNIFVIPNGETFYQVLDRVHRLFMRLRLQDEESIALITHRVVIINILLYFFKLDPSHFWDFQVQPASITQIEYTPDNTFRLIKLNETRHLEKLG